MKKLLSVALILLLIVSALAGCVKAPNIKDSGSSSSAAVTQKPDQPKDKPAGSNSKQTLSDSYEKYTALKSEAYARFEEFINSNTDAAMLGMTYLSVIMIDLELIPISVIEQEKIAVEAALGILGMKDISISKSGNISTLKYADNEGKKFEFKAEYDAASDSAQVSITDDKGSETTFFEYVKTDSGYASQYYSTESKQLIYMYFDDSNITGYSVQENADKPASIFRNTSLNEEFVQKGENFILIKDGKTLIHENGTDKTY